MVNTWLICFLLQVESMLISTRYLNLRFILWPSNRIKGWYQLNDYFRYRWKKFILLKKIYFSLSYPLNFNNIVLLETEISCCGKQIYNPLSNIILISTQYKISIFKIKHLFDIKLMIWKVQDSKSTEIISCFKILTYLRK
mgnify:CR=1 FL=1